MVITPWLSTCSHRTEWLSAEQDGSMIEHQCIAQDPCPQPVIKVEV